MPAARALPWLLVGVVLAGCARTGQGVPVAPAPDALVDLRALDPSIRIEMPSGFDDFSERAHRGWAGASPEARRNVARLEEAMAAEGFEPLPTEWWHFDGPGWERYELLDRSLTE